MLMLCGAGDGGDLVQGRLETGTKESNIYASVWMRMIARIMLLPRVSRDAYDEA